MSEKFELVKLFRDDPVANDAYIEEFIRVGNITEDDRVLNVGPGSSSTTLPFALAEHSRYVLRLDTRPDIIPLFEALRKDWRARTGSSSEVIFSYWCDQKPFPAEDASINVVCFYGTLNNVSDPTKLFLETLRVLKPDGRLIWAGVGVPLNSKKFRELQRAIQDIGQNIAHPSLRKPIIRRYTLDEQVELAFKAGFKFIYFRPFLYRVEPVSQLEKAFKNSSSRDLLKEAMKTLKNSYPDYEYDDAYGFIAVLAKQECDCYDAQINRRNL